MISLEGLLEKLQKATQTPSGGWKACCPSHVDENPSLTVAVGKDGKILMNCKAGCDFGQVVEALGMKPGDFFPETRHQQRRKTIVQTYDYTDHAGTLLFQKVRFKPKDFSWRKQNESGDWVWGKGSPDVLYNLPALLEMSRDHDTCYLVEGEKDADAAMAAGVPGTSPSLLNLDTLEPLKVFDLVVIVADRDEKGKAVAQKSSELLLKHGVLSRIVYAKVEDPKADLTDHLDAGFSMEDLVPEDEVDIDQRFQVPVANASEGLYGIWIARRFANLSHGRLEFSTDVAGDIGWLGWNGRTWSPDANASHEVALDLSRELRSEAAIAGTSEKKQEEIYRASSKCSSIGSGVNGLRTLASEIMRKGAEDFDCEPHLLNVENGVVDLRTGELRRAHPAQRFTTYAPVAFTDADPEGGDWGKFVKTIIPDESLRRYVQRSIGYMATGLAHEQVFFIWLGSGANGKSVLSHCLSQCLGDRFLMSTQFSVFTTAVNLESKTREFGRLRGARMVVASEPKVGAQFDTAALKEVTGGEAILGRHLFCNAFTYRPTWTPTFMCNNLPKVSETDHGTWRRIRAIPFRVQIPEAVQDRELSSRIIGNDLPSVLSWIVAGAISYFKDGLGTCPAVEELTSDYRASEDVIGGWIDDQCSVGSGSTPVKELWDSFVKWADTEGHGRFIKQMNSARFSRDLGRRGYPSSKTGGIRVRQGIQTKTEMPEYPF